MFQIHKTLDKLTQALKENKPITCNHQGEWNFENFFNRCLHRCLGLENSHKKRLALALIQALDSLEKFPVRFVNSFHETNQAINYLSYIQAAEILIQNMKNESSNGIQNLLNLLEQRVIALQYRLEKSNGGLSIVPFDKSLFERLHSLAAEWKSQQAIFFDKSLTDRDLKQLKETVEYSKFVQLLFKNEGLKDAFFEWILRDKNPVAPFIQFPAMQKKIVDCALNGRLGRLGKNLLAIKKKDLLIAQNTQEKILTLPFEGNEISILDEDRIYCFRGNYRLSIKEVFQIFKDKNFKVGNLELMKEGVINWNVHLLGWWDADKKKHQIIDLHKQDWWKQLPLFEVLSKHEAQKKYGWHLDGVKWNAAASASRGTPTLDFERSHAYLEVAIPISKEKYAIYDFGKFAYEFPSTFFENLKMFCHNVHATIAYPDENVFYSHRQHANHSFSLSPIEGARLMNAIREDMIIAQQRNLVYQIESENCAKWLHEKLEAALGEKRVPNLFKMHLLNTEPFGAIATIFNLIKKLPAGIQTRVLTALHLPFGARAKTWIIEEGKKICKSLATHDFWETGEVFLPAYLHHQKEKGVLVLENINSHMEIPIALSWKQKRNGGNQKKLNLIDNFHLRDFKKIFSSMNINNEQFEKNYKNLISKHFKNFELSKFNKNKSINTHISSRYAYS